LKESGNDPARHLYQEYQILFPKALAIGKNYYLKNKKAGTWSTTVGYFNKDFLPVASLITLKGYPCNLNSC